MESVEGDNGAKHESEDDDAPFVNNLAVFPLEERAHFRLPSENCCDQFSCDLLLELVLMSHIPFLQTELSLP